MLIKNKCFCVVLSVLFIIQLSGCGDSDEDLFKPAELVSFDSSIELRTLWKRSVGKGINDQDIILHPVIAGSLLYVIDQKGLLLTLDKKTGEVLAKKKTGYAVSAGLATDLTRLFLATWNGDLVCLDLEGKELWKVSLASEMLVPPVIEGDLLVAQTTDGKIHGLSVQNGKQNWLFDSVQPALTLRGTGAPLLLGGKVLAGLANGKVVALDASNGMRAWERQVAIPEGHSEIERLVDVKGRLLVNGWRCYGVSYQGKVFALDIRSGALLWQEDFSSLNSVSFDSGKLFLSDSHGAVVSFDATSGALLWRQEKLSHRGLTSPMIDGNALVVGDAQGYLHWLSLKDGAFMARVKVGGDGIAAPALVNSGIVYVYGKSGKLAAYSRESAREVSSP